MPESENNERYRPTPEELQAIINIYDKPTPELFKEILNSHKLWLIDETKGTAASLMCADLRGLSLRGVDLRRAYLGNTDLRNVDLGGADLSGANLFRVNLEGAHLENTNLSGAYLAIANLSGTNLKNADLSNADLNGAKLVDSKLNGTNLKNANLSKADLNGAKLVNSNLNRAKLVSADLSDVDLRKTNIDNVNFVNVNFENAILSNLDCKGKDFKRANFKNATLNRTDLSLANLSKTNLRNANLTRANLHLTNLTNARLFDANLTFTKLIGANLRDADLRFAKLLFTNFRDAKLRDANLLAVKYPRFAILKGTDLTNTVLEDEDTKVINSDFESIDLIDKRTKLNEEIDNLENKLAVSINNFTSLTQINVKSKIKLNTLEQDSEEYRRIKVSIDNDNAKLDVLDKEIATIKAEIEAKTEEQNSVTKEINDITTKKEQLERALTGKIDRAINSLKISLENTDKQINRLTMANRIFALFGFLILIGLIGAVIYFLFTLLTNPQSIFTTELTALLEKSKQTLVVFFSFPLLLVFLAGSALLKQYRSNLLEIRHYSEMKHQIELYSGLLKAAQHTAASINDIEKSEKYVEETFTKIRDKILTVDSPRSELKEENSDLANNTAYIKLLNDLVKNLSAK